jgi:hypothetical protein
VLAFNLSTTFVGRQINFNASAFVSIHMLATTISVVILVVGFARGTWWWRAMFLSLVALLLADSTLQLLAFFGYVGTAFSLGRMVAIPLASLVLVISVVCDYRIGLKRDWIHFAGVAIFLLMFAFSNVFVAILLRIVPASELLGRG